MKFKAPPTGLCDRLVDIVGACTYANIQNEDVSMLIYWPLNKRIGNAFNAVNKIDYVHKYMVFPSNVVLTTDINEFNQSSEKQVDIKCSPGTMYPITLYKKFKTIDYSHIKDIYNKIAQKIKPSKHLQDCMLNKLNFTNSIAIHLRRGDKVKTKLIEIDKDICVHVKEISSIEETTINILNSISDENTKLYVCSDDEEYKKNFIEKYCLKNVIEISYPREPLIDTFIDFFIMTNVNSTIMSTNYSTFSIFSSFVGNHKLFVINENNSMLKKFLIPFN